MSYAWIIDVDHIAEEDEPAPSNMNAKGMTGPSDAPDWMLQCLDGNLEVPEGVEHYKFKMFDDDGNLYYTGRMINDEGETEEAMFSPLNNFGMPNAGATEIQYKNADGKWEGL